jgi:hypothetical protein
LRIVARNRSNFGKKNRGYRFFAKNAADFCVFPPRERFFLRVNILEWGFLEVPSGDTSQ